jgi:uncharacterized protein
LQWRRGFRQPSKKGELAVSEEIDMGTKIRTLDELEEFGTPAPMTRDKVLDALHEVHVEWLAATPLVFVATAAADGRCDVSPKGDPPGFVHVLDAHTIAVPERPGNRRMDGYHNVLSNPHVGLICVIPGRGDTMRVNGTATLVRDAPFMPDMRVHGHRPSLALIVNVEEVFFHCAKAFRRANAWDPLAWNPDGARTPADVALSLWRKGQPRDEVLSFYEHRVSREDLYST